MSAVTVVKQVCFLIICRRNSLNGRNGNNAVVAVCFDYCGAIWSRVSVVGMGDVLE